MNLTDLTPDQIDERKLNARLYSPRTGLRILFGPQKVEEFQELDADWAAAIVRQVSAMADFIVIDLPPIPSAASRAALSLADVVALVLEPELGCLTAARVTIELLVSWGISKELIGAVVSRRAATTMSTPPRDIKKRLGCEILGVVTPAVEACLAAQEQGTPLVLYKPDSMASITLTEMANRLAAEKPAFLIL